MSSSNRPIFIVGANRSGTTLLRLVLNAHSRIAVPDELDYIRAYVINTPIADWQAPAVSDAVYAQYVDHWLSRWTSFLPELDPDRLRADILRHPPTIRAPYATVLQAWADHYGKARWGEKTPGNLFYADILVEMFPDAQFIYLVRDPRAGVASMQRVDFFPDDPIFNAMIRQKSFQVGRRILHDSVPPDQRTTLRYEDLVSAPEATVRTLCSFLQEPFEEGMLDFHRQADQYMRSDAATSFNHKATRPISADRTDSWRSELSSTAVALIERICADEMDAFGYDRSPAPIPVQTRIEWMLKRGYWAWQTWRHRDQRHYVVRYPMFGHTRNGLKQTVGQLLSLS